MIIACSMSTTVFAQDDRVMQQCQDQATSQEDLGDMLQDASESEAKEIIEQTDKDIVAERYQVMMDESFAITNDLVSDTETDDMDECEELAEDVAEDYDSVEDIDVAINEDGDYNEIVYAIETDYGDIEVSIEGGKEDSESDVAAAFIAGHHNKEITKAYDYGKCYTQINNKSDFVGYPVAYFKFRVGYTLYKEKKIAGRYLKAYEDSESNGAAQVTITPMEDTKGWDKKAKNSSYIKAHCKFKEKFYVKGIWALTYTKKINYKVKPIKWNKKTATVFATGYFE